MDKIQVSVVIPVYNCERYIETALASVKAQETEWECIVIDDCSTDDTARLIQPFLDDERFRYVRNESNLGVAAGRNLGVSMARGKYVAFLDGDDYWTDDKLMKQYRLMEDKHAVISSTGRELVDKDGTSKGRVIGIPLRISYRELLKGNVLNTSGVMVLREVIERFPMSQDHLHEDYITWLSILKEYDRCYGINEPLLKYRVVRGSKSADKIKSAKMTYGVYRYMGYGRVRSFYYFCFYAVNGVIKYIGKA